MELMLEISFQARVDDTDCRLGVLSVEFVRQFQPPTVAQDSDWILLKNRIVFSL